MSDQELIMALTDKVGLLSESVGSLREQLKQLKKQNELLQHECETRMTEKAELIGRIEKHHDELIQLRTYVATHVCESKRPNPALENVLAKLRVLLPRFNDIPDDRSLFAANLINMTIGELRRLMESEKEAGK